MTRSYEPAVADDFVIVLDYWKGPSAHALNSRPMAWDDFVAACDRGEYDSALRHLCPTRMSADEAATPFALSHGTTVYRRSSTGTVEVCGGRG